MGCDTQVDNSGRGMIRRLIALCSVAGGLVFWVFFPLFFFGGGCPLSTSLWGI